MTERQNHMLFDPKEGNKIPRARETLLGVADALDAMGDLQLPAYIIRAVVHELMHRNPPSKPIARTRQAKIDTALVREVLAYAKANPHLHNRIVGRKFHIDGGRVSEIIKGYRTLAHPQGTPEWRGDL